MMQFSGAFIAVAWVSLMETYRAVGFPGDLAHESGQLSNHAARRMRMATIGLTKVRTNAVVLTWMAC